MDEHKEEAGAPEAQPVEPEDEERVRRLAMLEKGIAGWYPLEERKQNGSVQDRDFQWLCTIVYQDVRRAIGKVDPAIEAAPTDDAVRQVWFAVATGVGMALGVTHEMLRRLGVKRAVREAILRNALPAGAALVSDAVEDRGGGAPTRAEATRKPVAVARVNPPRKRRKPKRKRRRR